LFQLVNIEIDDSDEDSESSLEEEKFSNELEREQYLTEKLEKFPS